MWCEAGGRRYLIAPRADPLDPELEASSALYGHGLRGRLEHAAATFRVVAGLRAVGGKVEVDGPPPQLDVRMFRVAPFFAPAPLSPALKGGP